MQCKVIDNFLPKDDFIKLQSQMLGYYFPWFYNDYIKYIDDGQFQYIHLFYGKDDTKDDDVKSSSFYPLIHDCLRELRPKRLERIKANSNPQTSSHFKGGYHIDYSNITTSILYINTNNGGTQFEDGTRVKSIANRIVTFDCSTKHAPVSCTDEKRRIVVNFNYYKSKEIMEKNYIGKK